MIDDRPGCRLLAPRLALALALLLSALPQSAEAAPMPQGVATLRAVDDAVADAELNLEPRVWSAVRLEGEALERAPIDLSLLDVDGAPIPFHLAVVDDTPVSRATIMSVDEQADGWRVTISVSGDETSAGERTAHHRLLFEVDEPTVAAAVSLDASTDGAAWRPLATADLFRLGDAGTLQRLAIDYPPTDAPFLRLRWPRAAGFPTLERLAVGTLGVGERKIPLEPTSPTWGDGAIEGVAEAEIRLPAPGFLARRLDLELTPWRSPDGETPPEGASSDERGDRERIAFHVERARNGRWETLATGTRDVSGPIRLRVPLASSRDLSDTSLAGPTTLRIRSWGASPTGAKLVRAALGLRFEAEASRAPYRLAWGFGEVPPRRLREGLDRRPTSHRLEMRRLEMEPPRLGPWPRFPARLVDPGAEPDEPVQIVGRIETVVADEGLQSVEVDTAELPAGGRLRLLHDGRQLPFVARSLPVPRRAWSVERQPQADESQEAGPREARGAAREPSRVVLEADELGRGDVAAGVLSVAARGPFSRRVRLVAERPGRPGVDPQLRVLAGWTQWRCLETAPPCAIELELDAPDVLDGADAEVRLEIDDGDDPPLLSVELTLWRERTELRFVHPPVDDAAVHGAVVQIAVVQIAVAGERAAAPRYDLETLLRQQVIHAPAATARLVFEAVEDTPVPRWWLPTALAAAGLVLLLFLLKLLRDATHEPAEDPHGDESH